MKIIGIDFGTKKVGVALSNEEATLAFPVDVFSRKGIENVVLDLAKEEGVGTVVAGESTQFDMKDNPLMKDIRECAANLEKSGLQIVYENEFMSSMQASRIQGYNKKQDASAAAIILQSYLDKQKTQ